MDYLVVLLLSIDLLLINNVIVIFYLCWIISIRYIIALFIFIWIYSGFTWISLTLDNSNIGFNLPIIILFPIINWIAESESKSNQYIIMFILLFFLLLLFLVVLFKLQNWWIDFYSFHLLACFPFSYFSYSEGNN